MTSFLKALNGVNDEACPVWFMRQAGRYLPSYQELKKEHSLLELFKTPKLAAQVTLLPFKDLELDAAIIFSDILVVFEACGFSIDYPIGKGPQIFAPQTPDEILSSLKLKPVETSLDYVFEAINLVKPGLKVPLLGFSATPFTLLAYLLEKPMTEAIEKVKKQLYENKKTIHELLSILTDLVIDYGLNQIKAGIDAFQLFDTASTWLSDEAFKTFSLPYTEKILKAFRQKNIPTLLFSKSSSSRVEIIKDLPLNGYSMDWTSSFKSIKEKVPAHLALQGNLDPFLTTLEFKFIEEELETLLQSTLCCPNFIFNLGHGVFPNTRLDTLQAIIRKIKSFHQEALGGIEHRIASGLP
jgi:uroporphyrinogen decarboxylase